MYGSGRGRSGPMPKTAATVQCQKCLKRDECPVLFRCVDRWADSLERHYSYECKANPQERPYVSRPSRSQQFFNPKLRPKLTEDTPDAAQKKKGVADEELAKREAERAKKLDVDELRESGHRRSPARRRSDSYDSVSSISTGAGSLSPERRAVTSAADERGRGARHESPRPQPRRQDSVDSRSDYSRERSESPQGDYYSREPTRRTPPAQELGRGGSSLGVNERVPGGQARSRRSYSRSMSRSRSRSISSSRSRSPSRSPAQQDNRRFRDRDEGRYGGERQAGRRAPAQQAPLPPRERSLSPFSKRLALTQSMNL